MEGVRIFNYDDYYNTLLKYLNYIQNSKLDDINIIDLSNIKNDINNINNINKDIVSKLTILQKKQLIQFDLKELLFGLSRHLFGSNVKMIWREDFFPFTLPSFELDVAFIKDSAEIDNNNKNNNNKMNDIKIISEENDDKWLEVLGCGIIHDDVMKTCIKRGKEIYNIEIDEHGWAFGLGLERLAMILFSIPDIRLFW